MRNFEGMHMTQQEMSGSSSSAEDVDVDRVVSLPQQVHQKDWSKPQAFLQFGAEPFMPVAINEVDREMNERMRGHKELLKSSN